MEESDPGGSYREGKRLLEGDRREASGVNRTRKAQRVPRKAGYHHGNLRKTLIDVALRLVGEKGSAAVTLREVARIAGVSHQAPYRHFADRAELLAAVAEEGFQSLHAYILDRGRAASDPRAALRAIGIAYVEFAVEHPAHFRVMYGVEAAQSRRADATIGASAASVFAALTQTIAEAQRGQNVSSDTLDYALAAWSMVHGLASLLVDGQLQPRLYGDKSPVELADIVARTLRRGLGEAPTR